MADSRWPIGAASGGSRFIAWQLYRFASRRLPENTDRVSEDPRPCRFYAAGIRGTAHPGLTVEPWIISGSRLLHAYRSAARQSGSPPGYAHAPRLAICYFLSYVFTSLPRVREINGIVKITRTRHRFAQWPSLKSNLKKPPKHMAVQERSMEGTKTTDLKTLRFELHANPPYSTT
jgi:hypothetical protein